jgi:ornithine cyclodeaminase/alanine dehydrogenase
LELLYLSRRDVEQLALTIDEVINLVVTALREKGYGRVEMPPKPGVHPVKGCFIHAMPASLPGLREVGVKWVSGYHTNPARGLPYITGLIVLNDYDTGLPIAVMDASWITAKRTAAATALAARYLARRGAERLGVIGCGVQGESNIAALQAVCPNLKEVYLYDIVPEKARRLGEMVSTQFGYKAHTVTSPKEAVTKADILVTATNLTPDAERVVEAGWVKPGALACPLEFDCYWRPEAIRSMDKVFTDDRQQLDYYRAQGYF